MSDTNIDLAAIEAERERIRDTYLKPEGERPASSVRGIHHTALLCSDVERTIRFYQDVLEFPLTDIFENRDYKGSNHFFFDLGNGNLLAFFDFPGLGPGAVRRGARRVAPHRDLGRARRRGSGSRASSTRPGSRTCTRAGRRSTSATPTATRLELIADPLGEMYGTKVL